MLIYGVILPRVLVGVGVTIVDKVPVAKVLVGRSTVPVKGNEVLLVVDVFMTNECVYDAELLLTGKQPISAMSLQQSL